MGGNGGREGTTGDREGVGPAGEGEGRGVEGVGVPEGWGEGEVMQLKQVKRRAAREKRGGGGAGDQAIGNGRGSKGLGGGAWCAKLPLHPLKTLSSEPQDIQGGWREV